MWQPHWHLGALVAVSLLTLACGPGAQPAAPAQSAKPVAAPAPAAQPPAKPEPVKIHRVIYSCCPLTSAYYPYAVAVAKVINDNVPGAEVTVTESAGAVEGLNRLQSGQFTIISSQAIFAAEAYQGLAQLKDKPVPGLRTLWMYDVGMNAYVVRADSGITSLAQLDGSDFAGGTGTYTEVLARNAFAAAGISPKWYRGGLNDALSALKDRRVVGLTKATSPAAPDAGLIEVHTTMPLRFLTWSPELIAKVKQTYDYYTDGEIPAGLYKAAGNEKAIRTWAAPQAVLALKDFDAEFVYQLVKAVDRNKEPQAAAYKPSGQFDFAKLTAEMSPLPVHAGTLRYLRERGLPVRPETVPPEAR